MRVSGGGTDSFFGFEYFGLITLASQEFRVLSCGSSGKPAVFAHFWLRQCRMWGSFNGFLCMCGVWSGVFHVAFAMITRTVPAQVLIVALRSVADVAAFSPIPRFLC